MRVDKLNHLTGLLNAALISSVLAVLLVFVELRYASQSYSKLPYLLFAILWFLPTAFVIAIAPLVRAFRTRDSVLTHPVALVLRIAFLTLVAVLWIGLIQDQLPCFLGMPNCD